MKPAVAVDCHDGPCTDAIFYEDVTWHASLTMTTDALAGGAAVRDRHPERPERADRPRRLRARTVQVERRLHRPHDRRAGEAMDGLRRLPGRPMPDQADRWLVGFKAGMLGTVDGVSLR